MIEIAEEKHAVAPVPGLLFRTATAESIASPASSFDAVLGFNYLHLVRDPGDTLRRVHGLLVPGGLFISKTPCLADMNPLIRTIMLPTMRVIGLAPYVSVFGAQSLSRMLETAGFDIVATESHATKGRDARPLIVARKTRERARPLVKICVLAEEHSMAF